MKIYTVTKRITVLESDGSKYITQLPLSWYKTIEEAECNREYRILDECRLIENSIKYESDNDKIQNLKLLLERTKENSYLGQYKNGKFYEMTLFLIQEITL